MKTLSDETEKSFTYLKNYLSALGSAAVAYSGGVDSTLLLYAASQIQNFKLSAYTVKNAMVSDSEISSAIETVKGFGINHHVIDIDILSFAEIADNSSERCYHCKSIFLNKIINAASDHGFCTILEGSHTGDLSDYRPGLKAIRELGVVSPLMDAGFDKTRIYELSAYLDLPMSGKESNPCLATRIPYGTTLTVELLQKAETAEKILSSFGFRKVRARIHGDILRIEVDEKMIADMASSPLREKVCDALGMAGFAYITLDLQGYRTGSMNLNIEGHK